MTFPPPPSPELEPFCKNCGGIRSAHIEEMTGSLRCLPGRDSWFRARVDAPPPPSPTQETAELNTLLDEMLESRRALLMHEGKTFEEQEAFCDREDAARSALERMYTRQREEIERLRELEIAEGNRAERWREIAIGTPPAVFPDDLAAIVAENASLSSQLERLKGEVEAYKVLYRRVCDPLQEVCQRYKLGLGGDEVHELVIAELERLKADSLTEEELIHIHRNWRPVALCQMCRDIIVKLDSRLSSDSGTEDTK